MFFDIVYYTGRRGKEDLWNLNKKSFEVKTGSDGLDYIELTFNKKTEKNQGDSNSSGNLSLHNDHHIISSQPNDILCPVKSFKQYVAMLHHEYEAFFQHASSDKKTFDNRPIGKNTLATMMKDISEDAKLSRIYMNHCIRKTTATALHRKGFNLNEIQNVTKHKNLDSLKHYIGAPTYKEKQSYNEVLLTYAENETDELNLKRTKPDNTAKNPVKNTTQKLKINEPNKSSATPKMPSNENINPENCLVPMLPQESELSCDTVTPLSTQMGSVINSMHTASNIIQSATFNNCNFTFQMPK